jgi:hypothetical protein
MKLLLSLSLVTLLAASSTAFADSFDSETATIQKAGPTTAKVLVDKKTYVAPISFGDGADWGSVKDHYELDPAAVSLLASKKTAISIGSDGTASFTKKKK